MLAIKLTKRPRGWTWEVRDDDTGKLMARGRERDRPLQDIKRSARSFCC